MVGASSDDIRLTTAIAVPSAYDLAAGALAGAALATPVTLG